MPAALAALLVHTALGNYLRRVRPLGYKAKDCRKGSGDDERVESEDFCGLCSSYRKIQRYQ